MQIVWSIAGPWILNQVNFCLANSTQVDLGRQNIDDYFDLPNKFFQGSQPNTAFVDRQRDQPIVKIWPTPNQQAFYNGTIVVLARRYIQDPGSMTDSLEIPARWIEGVTSRLGMRLMDELPLDPAVLQSPFLMSALEQRRTRLEQSTDKAESMMWAEERPSGPIRLTPNLTPYTS